MNSNDESQQLTYGSIISISHFLDDNSFITVEGFIEQNVMLRNDLQKTNPFANNLFQIFPKFNNATKGDIMKQLNEQEQEEQDLLEPENIIKDLIQSQREIENTEINQKLSKDDIIQYQENLINETKYNIHSFEKSRNIKIQFKQPIQLLHLVSSRFLACYQKESKPNSSNYLITLDDYSSDATLFKILPSYQFQKEGEQVIYARDIVYIVRAQQFMNKETYIHASTVMHNRNDDDDDDDSKSDDSKQKNGPNLNMMKYASKLKASSRLIQKFNQINLKARKARQFQLSENAELIDIDLQESVIKKGDIHASIEQKTQWKISIFSEYIPESQQNLKCGDVIWLHHSETNSTISAALKGMSLQAEGFSKFNLMKWMKFDNMELKIMQADIKESYDEYLGESNSMWIIENQDVKQGGLVEYKKKYKFRHLSTGNYLEGIPNKNNQSDRQYLKLSQVASENSHFYFVPLKNSDIQDKYVKKASFVYIKSWNNFWLDVNEVGDDIQFEISQQDQLQNSNNGTQSKKNKKIQPNKKLQKNKKLNKAQNQQQLKQQLNGQLMELSNKQDVVQSRFYSYLHYDSSKEDQSVFKLYSSTPHDVWEIMFLIYSLKGLKKFYRFHAKKFKQEKVDSIKLKDIKKLEKQVMRVQLIIVNLTNFCCNKFNNSQLGLRYDSINPFRQRLMKEQNFIDILIKLLTIIMSKDDLNAWSQCKTILEKNKQQQHKNQNKGKQSTEKDLLDLVILKVSLSKDIYKLIGSICKDNVKNQIYTFKFIPNLLEHIQYIPESIDFIISILQGNEILISQLSEGLELDLIERKIEQGNQMDQQIIQTLTGQQSKQSTVQSFQIESNILEWFVTLLNKENISHRTKILGFLRFACKFEDRGVNLNQENIYKLIKKIDDTELKIGVIVKNGNEIEMPDQYKMVSINNKLLLPVQCKNPREQEFIIEQLQFFADVSYDRNHLWGQELRNQFQQKYLFDKIWNVQSEEIDKKLQPSFCKLAMSLYIDCYPFDRKQLPSLCKLYSEINHVKNQAIHLNLDQEEQFKTLMENLMNFLDKIKQQILNTLEKNSNPEQENQYQQIDKYEKSIYSELLYNSADLLHLILDLDIIQIMYKDPQEIFKKMVEILISLLMYDCMNQDYLSVMMKYQKQQVDRRKKKFKDENEFRQIKGVFDLFKFFKQKAQQAFKDVQAKAQQTVQGVKDNISGSKKDNDEDDDQDNQDDPNDIGDDITISTNPLIRGCIKLHIKLSSLIKDNFKMTDLEINIKLKICDIFDQFLDMRQEYMINNLLSFFKNEVIKKNNFDEDDKENEIKCQTIIADNYLGLLPNIPKTGILSIDEPENDKQISFQEMLKKLKEMQQQSQKKKQFFNFQQNNVINDLDQYYSMAMSEQDNTIDYIGVLLPQFLTTVYFVNNEDLECRVISILMRIYNQRQELIDNMSNLQVIFDSTKTKLYTLLEKYQKELQNYVDQSEIWLTNFVRQIKSQSPNENQEIQKTLSIMLSVRWGFFNEINIENNEISLQRPENQLTVDVLKQSLQRSLNIYMVIICLIRDQIQHFIECIRNQHFPISKKTQISTLFIDAFQYLKFFCMRNYQNQMLLFEYSHVFTNKLQFNIGQIDLICEIFKDNDKLLSNEIDSSFVQIFVDCIEKYGRQKRFLKPLVTILLNKSTYKFDNQLLVLNLFLPGQNIGEINHKLLYSKEVDQSIVFDFEGKVSLIQNDFIEDISEGRYQLHEPYYYHKKLIDLLISTTLINKIGDENFYNYQQSDLSLNDNFTINAARLRKIFKSSYLLELLIKPDNIINHIIFHFHRHNQHNIEKNPTSTDQKFEEEQLNSQRGMTILKSQLCHFLRLIHITSEKIHHSGSDLENEFYKLLKFENERISQIKDDIQSNTYNKYTEYLIEGILPLFMSFYERILKDYIGNKQTNEKNSNMEDESPREENINLRYLFQFANCLSQKIIHSLYKNIQSYKQVMILEKFFDDHQNTQYYQIFKLRNDKESSQNIIECKSHIFGLYQKRNMNEQNLFIQDNEIPKIFDQNKFQEEQNFLLEEQKLVEKKSSNEIKLQFQAAKNNIFFLAKKLKNQQIEQEQEESLLGDAEKIDKIWFIFRKEFSSIKIIEDQIKKEKETLSEAILNIQKISSDMDIKQKSSNRLTFLQIASKLIQYLLFGVNKPKNKQTIINLLNVLEKIINSKKDEEKKEIQNNLNKMGSTRIILIVLSESSSNLDSETYRYFLMFINALLEGGNKKVQETVYEFFTTYQKSEVIFQRFNQVIQTQIEQIQIKAQQKRKKQQAQTQTNLLYEYEDETEVNEQEILRAEEDEKVMNQVLKFLQNCVEGHYLDLQNYVRQQTSSRNSYDIIKMVTELLYAYYQNRSQHMFDNMIKCLDTLNELVQGPCPENQIAVAESKFFEMANDLFSNMQIYYLNLMYIDFFIKSNSKGDNGNNQSSQSAGVSFATKSLRTATLVRSSAAIKKNLNLQDDITEWMVSRLQMKSLILVLSLIEQQQLSDQNPIIKQTMRKLPINLLQDQMTKQFKQYNQIYSQEYLQEVFDHNQNDPRELNNQEKFPPKYFETIIQNGFYSFFIICYYMESFPKMNNQFVQMYRAFLKKKLHISKSGLEDIIYGDNIIGQIISLIRGIIESFLLAATEQILKNLKNQGGTLTPEQMKEQQKAQEEIEKKVQQQSFDFYMRNTACIEVFRNQQIELIYFYILPHMTTIPKEKKNEFGELVERSSTKSKVQGLMDYANIIIDICEHEEKLRIFFSKNKILAIFANYEKLWKDLAFLFTLVLNILIIGSFAQIDGGDRMNDYNLFQNPDYSTKDSERIFKICGSIMTACSIFVLVIFLIKNVPLIIKKAWDQKIPILEDQKDKWYMWQFIIIIKLMTILIFLLQEIDVVYYLCYGIFAVLGTFWHPFFFSFHLTELLIRFPTLKNVVKSVYIPRKQFGLTFILFIIFEYVFSIVGFSLFSNSYNNTCESVLYCFLTTADQTFFSNGGVGGWLTGNDVDSKYNTEQNSQQPTYEWKRFLFDNLSNIILVIIMVNIWSGIIIDTFGSLREAEENKNQDIEDKCFICGNLKSTFDKLQDAATDGGFHHHIKINHYMWNYVNFIAYLKNKDPNDYNGIEQYVAEKIHKNDLTWFPFNVSREIMQEEEDQEVKILMQLHEHVPQNFNNKLCYIFYKTSSAADSLAKASQNLNKFKEKLFEDTTLTEKFCSNLQIIQSDSAED